MRKDAREAVYKLLFSNHFNDKFDDEFKNYIYFDWLWKRPANLVKLLN